ncbi:MAG: type II secretion system protein [Rickettsiales bacterium]
MKALKFNRYKKHGFTLLEMSVAIIIVGFIIAGIVIGGSIIRNSQIKSAISEFTFYKQTINNFRDKYNALPGDFAAASTVWSGFTNGDGNGLITTNITDTRIDEQFLAWQQLRAADMIKGNYTGVAGSGGSRDRIVDENIPKSELDDAGWGLISVTLTDIAGGYTAIPYTAPDQAPNHVLWLGGNSISGTADSQTPVLSTSEAFSIDEKIDNGLPGSGKVIAQANGGSGTCSVDADNYDTASESKLCSLVFKTGF